MGVTMKKLWIAVLLGLISTAQAETLFVDDFENGLGKWVGKNNTKPTAVVVDDPLNSGYGKVLKFTKKVIEGDIFSRKIISNRAQHKPYILEFDYLGLPPTAWVQVVNG
jgi:hypothetical protein